MLWCELNALHALVEHRQLSIEERDKRAFL